MGMDTAAAADDGSAFLVRYVHGLNEGSLGPFPTRDEALGQLLLLRTLPSVVEAYALQGQMRAYVASSREFAERAAKATCTISVVELATVPPFKGAMERTGVWLWTVTWQLDAEHTFAAFGLADSESAGRAKAEQGAEGFRKVGAAAVAEQWWRLPRTVGLA